MYSGRIPAWKDDRIPIKFGSPNEPIISWGIRESVLGVCADTNVQATSAHIQRPNCNAFAPSGAVFQASAFVYGGCD
jgi:hypothetical protein